MSPKDNQHQPNHTGSRGRRSRRAFLATIVTGFAVTGLAVQAPAASAATTFTQPTVNVGIIPLPGDVYTISANGTLIPILVFPRFEGHLSAFGESRRKLTKEVRSAEDKTAFPA